jgi:2-succinyl-5-enolpyruvyl-6-hydroxy-3-cyclohexene-1-carboxylate synthase
LHDLNSLAMLPKLPAPVTIVLINNHGGGIFDHLPIAQFPDLHERFFVTSHDLTFRHAAEQFGVAFESVSSIADFETAYRKRAASGASSIIEIAVDRTQNMASHRRMISEIGATIG